MAKLTKTTLFKEVPPRAETVMDKTTRVVKDILETEAQKRAAKTQRLRKTRLEREAATPMEEPDVKPRKTAGQKKV